MEKGTPLKALVIIHRAMLFGQVMFAAISFYLIYSGSQTPIVDKSTDKIIQVVAVLFAATGFFMGTAMFKKKLLEIRTLQESGAEKFAKYRSAALTQWALLEAPALVAIIGFFLSGNYALLALAGVLMILFFLAAPKRIKIAFQIGLSQDDADEL